MAERDIVLVANTGDDSVTAYYNETYKKAFAIFLKPTGPKFTGTGCFAKGPMVGPGFLWCSKIEGRLLSANIYDDSISVIDLDSLSVTNTIFAGSGPNSVEVCERTGRAFVSNCDSDSVSVIDLYASQLIGQTPCGIMPGSIALNRLDKFLYVANKGSNCVSVIDAMTMDKKGCLPVDGCPTDISFDSSGRRLFVLILCHENGGCNCLAEYSLRPAKGLRHLKLGAMPADLLYDGHRGKLYVLDAMDNRLIIIEDISFSVIKTVEVGKMPVSQALSPCGKYLHIVCSMDNCLYKVDLTTGLVTDSAATGIEPSCVRVLY